MPSAIWGRQIISAAIPDFHAKPKAVRQVVSRVLVIKGILILKKILAGESLYTFASSINFSSMLERAVCVADHTIGSTIKNAIKIGKSSLLNQKKARIINDATGTAFITCIAGFVE